MQSLCKVGGEAKDHRVWYGERAKDKRIINNICCFSISFQDGYMCLLVTDATEVHASQLQTISLSKKILEKNCKFHGFYLSLHSGHVKSLGE